MKLKAFSKAFWFAVVSILLTAVGGFGATPGVHREAYVTAAYEEFHSLLYFLSGSDTFLQALTPEERVQFELVGNSVIRHVIRLGPGATPGQDRTSTRVDFKLQFSARSEDFVLNPGEPERTAKMAGDIWFNLNVINNPKVSFGLLDAFQIMFHEFGHKIGEQKNQKLIDSVAAKIRLHLASYHKETILGPDTKVSFLAVPYLTYDRNPVDFQFEPVVIVDHQGQSASARMDVVSTQRSGVAYFPDPYKAQAYDRHVLTPKFSLEGGQLRIDWQIATRHSLIVADRFNYINLYTNLEKVKPYEKVEPLMEYQKLIQYVSAEQLQRLANHEYGATNLPLKSINIQYQPYTPANEKSRWLEKLKLAGSAGGRVEYTTVVESATPLQSALLLGEKDTTFYKFKGEVTPVGGQVYRLKFSLPAESAYEGVLNMYAVALNGPDLWDLEEVVKVPLKKSVEPRSISPSQIAVLGKDQWQFVQQIQNPVLDTEEIRWRFSFKNASAKIEQIEFMWVLQEDILKDGQKYGSRSRNIFEVIDQKDMKQTWVDGSLMVEVTATQASKSIPTQTNREGFAIQDSHVRAMVQLQVTDQNYNTFLTGTRLVQTGWKSAFTLKPKSNSGGKRCDFLFK
jgi:hypothetical protein